MSEHYSEAIDISNKGEFKKRIEESLNAYFWNPNNDKTLVVSDIEKWFEEARKEFYLALKHLKHRGIESPYVESIIKKWFGDAKS